MGSFTVDFHELEEFGDKLSKLGEKIKVGEISFDDLFNESFMCSHSDASSIDDMLKSENILCKTNEEFESLPEEQMDQCVCKHTDFSSWQDMIDSAAEAYLLSDF
mgnify:CR=1 FL=1